MALLLSLILSLVASPAIYALGTFWLSPRLIPRDSIPAAAGFAGLIMLTAGIRQILLFAMYERPDRPWWDFVANWFVFHLWTPLAVAAGFLFANLIQANPPWPAAVALVVGAYIAAMPAWDGKFPCGAPKFKGRGVRLRGGQLKRVDELKRESAKKRPADDPGFFWGGIQLPRDVAYHHFLVAGTTGSGKTVTLQLLMERVLREIRPRSNKRAIIYDAKGELPSLLANFNLQCPVYILNPFDERGTAWDIARDITRPEDAEQLAKMLSPTSGQERDPFYPKATVNFVKCLILALHEFAPSRWTLRDLICAAQLDVDELKALFEQVPHLSASMRHIFAARELPSVLVSVSTALSEFGTMAAAWDDARLKGNILSLAQWNDHEAILLLPCREDQSDALLPLNRLLVRRLVDILLTNPDDCGKQTWVFLDELADLGKLDKLPRLLQKGRTKGVCVALGFQDLSALQDPEKGYGKEAAASLIGLCNSTAYLRITDQETAEWASKQIGEVERLYTLRNESFAPQGGPGKSEHLDRTTLVLPTQLRDLDPCHGYYKALGHDAAWFHALDGGFLTEVLASPDADFPDYVPRRKLSVLQPWGKDDLVRLNLTFLKSSPVASRDGDGKATRPKLGTAGRITFPSGDNNAS